jgi:photosystem II stability/assembly factor-like uncharacterized protein
MRKLLLKLLRPVIPAIAFCGAFALLTYNIESRWLGEEEEEEGKAYDAFEWWYAQRALPGTEIPVGAFASAHRYVKSTMALAALRKGTGADSSQWESIGPTNIGGRVLSLAIDPENSDLLWAGSASGGLWKSTTGGRGAKAWTYVSMNYPVLSVSAVVIDPVHPSVMYIGTGEISGYNLGLVGTPGARTTYGLGILRSTDRGATWDTTGLNWTFNLNRSVQRIVINPKNTNVLYAATSEGVYKTFNAGRTWIRVLDTLMAMDVALNPVDTSIVYAACGQRNTAPNPGLFKSTNGGTTWTKVTTGLPATNFGRTALAIVSTNPSILFASIADAVTHGISGLYKSTDAGITWSQVSTVNYVGGQGWYNNVVAIKPDNPNIVFASGIDLYKSTTGGPDLVQKSYWFKGYGGVVAAEGPEGPSDYAHADHHALVFDPKNPLRIFAGTDGGIFESTDGGETFSGRNGGFVTAQFYNGFANADTDSLIALGGTQDNGTIKFQGDALWNKVYGGDGGWCIIDPRNKNVMFEEYVYLAISKSTNGGSSWMSVFTGSSDSANFIAPFVMAPSNSSILYAGGKKMYKSTNGGTAWFSTNSDMSLNRTCISAIGVSQNNPSLVIAGTGQRTNPKFELFYTSNGGTSWTKSASSLPNRFPTDIAFDPQQPLVAYATFSGYGTAHVYKTTDGGLTWTNISSNLPDIPTQAVVVDPVSSSGIYVGTDLGVFRTTNGGTEWEEYNQGMPVAMVLDLGFSKLDHRLRAATFGNGAYQRKVPTTSSAVKEFTQDQIPSAFVLEQNYPNPFNPATTIRFSVPEKDVRVTFAIYDGGGRLVETLLNNNLSAGDYLVTWNASRVASGVYYAQLRATGILLTRKMMVVK